MLQLRITGLKRNEICSDNTSFTADEFYPKIERKRFTRQWSFHLNEMLSDLKQKSKEFVRSKIH